MSSSRRNDVPRIAAAFAISLLVALALPFSARAAEDAVRTDPGDLPGYIIEARGAPLSILLYEPVIPVPVDPGEPHGEGSISYTQTKLETGPSARAVASSFWPGPAVGDGFATLCDQVTNNPQAPKDTREECNEEYRVKADARWPENKQFPREDEQAAPPTGGNVFASALGLDTFSRASSSESPNEEAVGFGNVKSRSDTVVVKDTAIATTVASAEDVALGGGVITIESVKTVLEATSDAKKGRTEGVTKVNGLTVGGQGYVVDSKGVRPVDKDKSGESIVPLPEQPGAKEMDKNLGIEIELVKHKSSVDGAEAARSAGGLRISIDTKVLKSAVMDNVPVDDILGELPEQTDELTVRLAPLLALGPQVDFIFGRGAVRAFGVEALEFNFPTPAPPPAPPSGNTGGGGGGTTTPPDTAPATGGTASGPGVSSGSGPAPQVGNDLSAPPAQAALRAVTPPVAAAATLPEFFGGLPPALVVGGLLLGALAGRWLAGFSGMAMAGAMASACDRGLPRTVPNLRPPR